VKDSFIFIFEPIRHSTFFVLFYQISTRWVGDGRRGLLLQLLDLEAGRKGLLQLLSLLLVLDDEGVEEPRATDLKRRRELSLNPPSLK
jgi:hypothetical protein